MKKAKKILIIISVIVIAVGMFILGRNGLNYSDGYTKNSLIETTKTYIPYVSIATGIIIVYLGIRYYKQGIIKVIATSILGILGSLAFAIAVMAIIKFPITRVIFSIMLAIYVCSILIITANFEEKI